MGQPNPHIIVDNIGDYIFNIINDSRILYQNLHLLKVIDIEPLSPLTTPIEPPLRNSFKYNTLKYCI